MSSWKPVPGYESLYEVSDDGHVKSLARSVVVAGKGGVAVVTQRPGRILRARLMAGYPAVALQHKGTRKEFKVHYLVLLTFVGPRPMKAEALHFNGVKSDNRLCNLRWGTSAENKADARRLGKQPMGSRSNLSTLKEEDIPVIRALYKQGFLQREIGLKFGVQQAAISSILAGRSWSHVKEN